ncbi:HesB/IscA family protein [Rhodoblastus sp.]|uniref:HesB/IscA family protein n=1 Tax=Rhodoblastus sp. TaxID=1962975 RepID=UPI0035B2EEB5
MIHLTDSAVNAVRNAIKGASEPVQGLRIKVETGGCAGNKYMMGLVRTPEENDEVVERDGVKVFVESASRDLLAGVTIDFVVAIEGAGFTFDNPNAEHSCSCGKSFG